MHELFGWPVLLYFGGIIAAAFTVAIYHGTLLFLIWKELRAIRAGNVLRPEVGHTTKTHAPTKDQDPVALAEVLERAKYGPR